MIDHFDVFLSYSHNDMNAAINLRTQLERHGLSVFHDQALANCADCGSEWDEKSTVSVGSFESNAWNLHDMHGNVMEWVEDCWHDNYEGAPEDGRAWLEEDGGDCTHRVLRSGSWREDREARSAWRWHLTQTDSGYDIGFRVVCSSSSSRTDP